MANDKPIFLFSILLSAAFSIGLSLLIMILNLLNVIEITIITIIIIIGLSIAVFCASILGYYIFDDD
jgi:hypothetical protein